jgi:hypothetical protein
MVNKDDPLFREVEEELRREQMAKLWEKYGTYIIGVAALIVVLVGGFKYWEAHQRSAGEAAGAQYDAAVALATAGKAEDAAKSLEAIANDAPGGYASLAELSLAGSQIKAGKNKEALDTFERLAKDPSADKLLASYAGLQAAALRLGEADYAEMQSRLTPLMADTSPWRFNARELLGTAALKAGKLEEARTLLAPLLSDLLVPKTTRDRVERMMGAVATAELGKASPPASSAAPAPASGASGTDTPATAPAAPK